MDIETWNDFSSVLFSEKIEKNRIEMADVFLLNNLHEIKNKGISNSLKYLNDFDLNYSI